MRRLAWDLLLGHVGYVNLVSGAREISSGYVVEIECQLQKSKAHFRDKKMGRKPIVLGLTQTTTRVRDGLGIKWVYDPINTPLKLNHAR